MLFQSFHQVSNRLDWGTMLPRPPVDSQLLLGQASSQDPLTMIASKPLAAPFIWSTAETIQRIGESAFTAMFIIAFLQAAIALIQYRTNPKGELIVPPGPTIGVVGVPTSSTGRPTTSNATTVATLVRNLPEIEGDDFLAAATVGGAKQVETTTTSTEMSRYARILNRFNRFMFLLIPLAFRTAGSLLSRQWHLLHIGFILSLARIFDIPTAFFEKRAHDKVDVKPSRSSRDTVERIVVIGDSLAIGLGTVNVFDKNKNQTVDYHLVENLSASPDLPGPAFPPVFAAHFAKCQNRSVHWRSAGVDGGTVSHIHHFCLDVIRQEVEKGRPPDCVVVLCGINDLKQFVSNPFKSVTPKSFRQKLNELVVETRKISPTTRVVLPALPTQMFRFDSPLNIFPLGVFLDTVVGFWEAQKKVVVDSFPSDDVMYVELSGKEIFEWYRSRDDPLNSDEELAWVKGDFGTLISADGVHPNARCYAKWAESVARGVCNKHEQKKNA